MSPFLKKLLNERLLVWLIPIGIIVGGYFIESFMVRNESSPTAVNTLPSPVAQNSETQNRREEPKEIRVKHPLQESQEKFLLPTLDQSDLSMNTEMEFLLGSQNLDKVFNFKNFIRCFVASVDNLPRQRVSWRLMPVKETPGRFLVLNRRNYLTISPGNSARYNVPYVNLALAINAKSLVALYVRFYPLFQQAYIELGYPHGYFNDRLIEVVDHLLATPELPPDAELVQPKVFYEYADLRFEMRSAGQKILMRIGNGNAKSIKSKLREIRTELTHLSLSR